LEKFFQCVFKISQIILGGEGFENKETEKKYKILEKIESQWFTNKVGFPEHLYDDERHSALITIVNDKNFLDLFKRLRYKYHFSDGIDYFFKKIDNLKPNFTPSFQDQLMTRRKTIGITKVNFVYKKTIIDMYDVGGQRNERKKWIHMFESVKAVCFICAISEYNQVLYEDDETNRIQESLDLFESYINNEYLRGSIVFLFLNKIDIFKEKIKEIDLKCAFSDYKGGKDYNNATKYIEEKFMERNNFDKERLHIFYLNSLDTEIVTDNVYQILDKMVQFK